MELNNPKTVPIYDNRSEISVTKCNLALGVGRVICGRWPCNSYLLVTLGKKLHSHHSGLLGHRVFLEAMILFPGRWS